ncbi:hypothetical protein [Rufibacter hautae]|uniref:DUF3592 domain-containing protein n=1 Tax=Rufibacter hautae TaxID=2595005 RepID=A0A5B6TKF7_9BACT|nr:hypothetical protein [Rufibacter hautae]KAA3439855.1 hypothetical protein FOA19_04065 [Rufibacter hautae]
MSKRGRRTLGVPTFPLPISGQFMPAILLIIMGLGLLVFKNLTQEVKHVQDLMVKEGTLINYSFKKTPEGERDYGLWLKEFAERFELAGKQESSFDTTAFKAALKPGDRLRVEYSDREDVLENGGVRRLYGLSAPAKNLTFFQGKDTVYQQNNGTLTFAIYGLLAGGILLYIWQIYKTQRQRNAYED